LIPDLEDEVAYTSFLNGLKRRQFKFSFTEQKQTAVAEAPRRATDFICATKIWVESTDASKKAKAPVDRNGTRRQEP